MRKASKIFFILGWCILLLLLASNCNANIVDNPDDVLYIDDATNWLDWQWNIGSKPNVDITGLSYTEGNRLTVSMTIKGSFNTQNSVYNAWFNTSDAYYHIMYTPQAVAEPQAIAFPLDYSTYTMEDLMNYVPPEVEASISGSTLTGIFDWCTEDHNIVDFHGHAFEYLDDINPFYDFWVDFAPDSYSSYGTYEEYHGDDDDNDDTTTGDDDDDNNDDVTGDDDDDDATQNQRPPIDESPGFGIITLVVAISIALILFRRKK